MLLLGASLILILSCLMSKFLYRFGVPTLVIFIAIGMFLGYDGPGNIYFDDAHLAMEISDFALAMIIFFGGFGLNWDKAKTSAKSATALSVIGLLITAFTIGTFISLVFKVDFFYAMILGSVISSTDAAAVFSILNSKKLNLKNNMSHLLEMESGSNDPIAYMLTIIFLTLVQGEKMNIPFELFMQIVVGVIIGVVVAKVGVIIINRIDLEAEGLYSILMLGFVILSFALAHQLGGNQFLSVYLTGIIFGNTKIVHKFSLLKYFDGISWLMQLLLFFTLGLLVFPSQLPSVTMDGIIIALFLTFIARPLGVFLTLMFTKYSIKEKLMISWGGFRGAASIVFATYALNANIDGADWIFNIVFIVALLSVIFQGSLFVPIAKKLDVIADESNLQVRRIYDEAGTISADLLEINISDDSIVANKEIIDIDLPDDILVIMIKRGGRVITPNGNTKVLEGDDMLFAGDKVALGKLKESFKKKNI
ncbi:MAG: potassium/proton antiporter [Erysipelotrichales bacterium]